MSSSEYFKTGGMGVPKNSREHFSCMVLPSVEGLIAVETSILHPSL